MLTIDPKTITAAQLRRCADILESIELLGRTFHAVLEGKQPPEQTVHVEPPAKVNRGRLKRKPMSAEAKAKISLAAKKRWKKARAAGRTTL